MARPSRPSARPAPLECPEGPALKDLSVGACPCGHPSGPRTNTGSDGSGNDPLLRKTHLGDIRGAVDLGSATYAWKGIPYAKPPVGALRWQPADVDVLLEEVHARISLLSLLTGTVAVTFDARLAGGSLEGEVEMGDSGSLRLDIVEPIQLQRVSIIRNFLGLPMGGKLSGDIDVTFPENIQEAEGHVNLLTENLRIGDGDELLRVLHVPGQDAGRLACLADAPDGVGVIRVGGEDGLVDTAGLAAKRYDAEPGTAYLLRPDGYVAARLLAGADLPWSVKKGAAWCSGAFDHRL